MLYIATHYNFFSAFSGQNFALMLFEMLEWAIFD